jgi:UDP-N-acetyl-D-glucosamine dehydrogenase
MAELQQKIEDRTATIAVLGLGYVGLPTAVSYARAGFHVIGVDVNADRVDSVNRGESHIEDVTGEDVSEAVSTGHLRAVSSVSQIDDFDVAEICVHTPLDARHEPDLTAITQASNSLVPLLRSGQLVILTSTSYPGTTKEVVQPELSRSGLRIGDEVLLAFAPERIDPGNQNFTFTNIPRVVGGVTEQSTNTAAILLESIVTQVIRVSDSTVAEMVKILENTFRMVNVGFANEMAMICHRLEINVWEVIDAASTKPFGFVPFRPGPGLGGHCIPVDPSYLAWKMRNLNFKTRFIDLGNDINRGMPDYVVRRCGDILNESSRSIRGSNIIIVGVAYKPGIADTRESPALEIADRLVDRGADVAYVDPHVDNAVTDRGRIVKRLVMKPSDISDADLILVVTDHRDIDWQVIANNASLILDTRGVADLRSLAAWRSL